MQNAPRASLPNTLNRFCLRVLDPDAQRKWKNQTIFSGDAGHPDWHLGWSQPLYSCRPVIVPMVVGLAFIPGLNSVCDALAPSNP